MASQEDSRPTAASPLRTADMSAEAGVGPILFLRGFSQSRLTLRALVVQPEESAPLTLTADGHAASGSVLLRYRGLVALGYDFQLPAGADSAYRLGDTTYPVNAALEGDQRVAFVSCNGQESGDRQRPLAQRNALWRRLAEQHKQRPFHLLIQGGDQIYADEVANLHSRERHHPVAAWYRIGDADIGDLREAMRAELFRRYLELFRHPEMAWIMARVPTLAMWDDHDICDGWGSLPPERMDSPLGRAVFDTAREFFLLFQCAIAPETPPAARPDLLCDRSGSSLGWHVKLPGLHLIAPDLRSERRPDRVMAEAGWRGLRCALDSVKEGHVFLISTVPALGPRLSWVEAAMHLTRRLEKYEDDLRDQWQSRAHRGEWRAFLELLLKVHTQGTPVTVLSGEIHLATHGTLEMPPGQTQHGPLHQLVASGITHPAPPAAYARGLGLLSRFGSSPLADNPIRLRPLPGRGTVYTAQRNYLVLERRAGRWTATWELEHDGATPPLAL